MNEIVINAPKNINCDMSEWNARYSVSCAQNVRLVLIDARSSIEIVVTKMIQASFMGPQTIYYIASPNFGVAIPGISSLEETFWITDQLIHCGMPNPDAVTVARVLFELGDF